MMTQTCAQLRLTAEDSSSTADAFTSLLEAGLCPGDAYRLVSEGLEKGLRARDMTKLAALVRARIAAGYSPAACEDAAKAMLPGHMREKTEGST